VTLETEFSDNLLSDPTAAGLARISVSARSSFLFNLTALSQDLLIPPE